jgi:hypothetical protein
MLTESTLIDKIEVLPETGHVQVRTATRILRDGVRVSETYHRHVITPSEPLSAQDPLVQAVTRAAWAVLTIGEWRPEEEVSRG